MALRLLATCTERPRGWWVGIGQTRWRTFKSRAGPMKDDVSTGAASMTKECVPLRTSQSMKRSRKTMCYAFCQKAPTSILATIFALVHWCKTSISWCQRCLTCRSWSWAVPPAISCCKWLRRCKRHVVLQVFHSWLQGECAVVVSQAATRDGTLESTLRRPEQQGRCQHTTPCNTTAFSPAAFLAGEPCRTAPLAAWPLCWPATPGCCSRASKPAARIAWLVGCTVNGVLLRTGLVMTGS